MTKYPGYAFPGRGKRGRERGGGRGKNQFTGTSIYLEDLGCSRLEIVKKNEEIFSLGKESLLLFIVIFFLFDR